MLVAASGWWPSAERQGRKRKVEDDSYVFASNNRVCGRGARAGLGICFQAMLCHLVSAALSVCVFTLLPSLPRKEAWRRPVFRRSGIRNQRSSPPPRRILNLVPVPPRFANVSRGRAWYISASFPVGKDRMPSGSPHGMRV